MEGQRRLPPWPVDGACWTCLREEEEEECEEAGFSRPDHCTDPETRGSDGVCVGENDGVIWISRLSGRIDRKGMICVVDRVRGMCYDMWWVGFFLGAFFLEYQTGGRVGI